MAAGCWYDDKTMYIGNLWPNQINSLFFCFVYLFVWGYSKIIHSHGEVTTTGEGLQILTYARHSWALNSEGSLACHTYCNTGHPFIIVIFKDSWPSHLLPSVYFSNGVVTTSFYDLGLSQLGFEHLTFGLRGPTIVRRKA